NPGIDLFTMFRTEPGSVSAEYWTEKLFAASSPARQYSPEVLRLCVLDAWAQEKESWGAAAAAIEADILEMLDDIDRDFEAEARATLAAFDSHDFHLAETDEWNLGAFTRRYLTALHAIVWGICKWD